MSHRVWHRPGVGWCLRNKMVVAPSCRRISLVMYHQQQRIRWELDGWMDNPRKSEDGGWRNHSNNDNGDPQRFETDLVKVQRRDGVNGIQLSQLVDFLNMFFRQFGQQSTWNAQDHMTLTTNFLSGLDLQVRRKLSCGKKCVIHAPKDNMIAASQCHLTDALNNFS